jgi:hypothetical protein
MRNFAEYPHSPQGAGGPGWGGRDNAEFYMWRVWAEGLSTHKNSGTPNPIPAPGSIVYYTLSLLVLSRPESSGLPSPFLHSHFPKCSVSARFPVSRMAGKRFTAGGREASFQVYEKSPGQKTYFAKKNPGGQPGFRDSGFIV